MSGLLRGKAALVTGASTETGAAIARALSRQGCAVALHYYHGRTPAEALQKEIRMEGGTVSLHPADLSSPDDVEGLFNSLGPIDVLVNHAHAEIIRKPFPSASWEDCQRQIDVVLKGSWLTCQCFLNRIEQGKSGSIIQVASAQLYKPVTGYTAFTAALSAVIGFTRSLALEVGPLGVRVNAIAPGFTRTKKTPHAPSRVQEKIIRDTPLGRLATPEDLGKAVVFFASELSEFVTGTCLTIDGGRSLS